MRDGGVIDGEDGLWSLVGRGNGVANSDTSEVDSVMVGFLNGRFMSVEHAAGMSYLRGRCLDTAWDPVAAGLPVAVSRYFRREDSYAIAFASFMGRR